MSDEFENDDQNLDGQDVEQQDYAGDYNSDADASYDDSQDGYDDGYYDDDSQYNDADGGAKTPAKMKREWANSITTNKKVKREEMRRKLKKAMLFMLVFALIVTSVVYIMLLFIQENNVRITASSQNQDTSISLSFDNNYWTPYLNAQGPTHIWDVSYSPVYGRERIDTRDEVEAMLKADTVNVGTNNGENFIRFTFMLRNNGNSDVNIDYEMSLSNDDQSGLQNAVRVMWGESFKNPDVTVDPDGYGDPTRTKVTVYAALSENPRLANIGSNAYRPPEEKYIEFYAYPVGSDNENFDWNEDFYDKLGNEGMSYEEATLYGYLAETTPFESKDLVFKRTSSLTQGDIMYCYVCIWLEGSDFDCVDSALGGYVSLGINFVAYA